MGVLECWSAWYFGDRTLDSGSLGNDEVGRFISGLLARRIRDRCERGKGMP